VLTLAMAFHELTTNAAKYGALSAPAGRIEISWQVTAQGNHPPRLQIDWVEQGGPAVKEPSQRGFGSRLIEGSIAGELHGGARMTFAPEGLRCEIVVPLDTATAERQSAETED
jgi:two-component sensor histidine kinase